MGEKVGPSEVEEDGQEERKALITINVHNVKSFFTNKKEFLENTFKQAFDKIHNIPKKAKPKPKIEEHEEVKKPVKIEPVPEKPPLPPTRPLTLPPAPPLIESEKVKADIERLIRLQKEEESLMKEIQKQPKIRPILMPKIKEKPIKKHPIPKIKEKPLEKYPVLEIKEKPIEKHPLLEIKEKHLEKHPALKIKEKPLERHEPEKVTPKIKKRRTKVMIGLLKEEKDLRSKIKELR